MAWKVFSIPFKANWIEQWTEQQRHSALIHCFPYSFEHFGMQIVNIWLCAVCEQQQVRNAHFSTAFSQFHKCMEYAFQQWRVQAQKQFNLILPNKINMNACTDKREDDVADEDYVSKNVHCQIRSIGNNIYSTHLVAVTTTTTNTVCGFCGWEQGHGEEKRGEGKCEWGKYANSTQLPLDRLEKSCGKS